MANVEGVFLLLIVGSVAAILCSCLEMVLDVRSRASENKVSLTVINFIYVFELFVLGSNNINCISELFVLGSIQR